MSSQRREPVGEPAPAKMKWYSYWPKWRRVMMGGALILLTGALVPAIVGEEGAPAWLGNVSFILGYGLLAYGFFLAMRARSELREWQSQKEDEVAEVLEEES